MLIVTKELLFLSSTIFGSSMTLCGRALAFAFGWLLSSFSVLDLYLSPFFSPPLPFCPVFSVHHLSSTFQLDFPLPPHLTYYFYLDEGVEYLPLVVIVVVIGVAI